MPYLVRKKKPRPGAPAATGDALATEMGARLTTEEGAVLVEE